MAQYSKGTEEIFGIARKKVSELGQSNISSEVLLYAVIEHGNNEGLDLLKKNGANTGKLRMLLTDRFHLVQRDMAVPESLPRFSMQMKQILHFAKFISQNGEITPETLVQSLYRTEDSVAFQILTEGGYSEPGGFKKKTLSERVTSNNTPALNAFSTDQQLWHRKIS